jgi:phosphatidate cytidylyltransferase
LRRRRSDDDLRRDQGALLRGDGSVTDGDPPKAAPNMRDVGVRVVAGIAMASVALAALWSGSLPFAVLVGAVAVVVSWEWGRIVRSAGVDAIFIIQAGAVIAAVLLASRGVAGLGLIAVLVAAILSALLAFGERGHMAALGALYAGLPAVALVWLRGADMVGMLAVLFLLLAVWTTDTGAYFAGRQIGGPKLMPRVSPNKTWSGLIGGIAAAGVVGLVFALLANAGLHPGRMTVSAMVLGLVSQAGDLFESALKREYGVKDASALIPGHGGFMDRIDGLAAAAVLAAIFAMAVSIQAPARALLGLN